MAYMVMNEPFTEDVMRGHCERFKRDDAKFASDFGGPLARNSEAGSLSSAGLMNQTTIDDLLPCELLPGVRQHQQPNANMSDPGFPTDERMGKKKREISYDGFRPKCESSELHANE
uniref:Uncharacterized protein n=1 Tax=Romanomermis culicivorax TaxID=13658 RepID=A0A915IRV9_ROMCU